MAEIEKLQSLQGMLDYPDAENPDKGTTEQQYQEFVRNHHKILSDLVATNLWQPETKYTIGQIVTSPNMVANTVAKVIRAGTTSSGEPAWSGAGNTLADGTVTYSIVYRTIDYATQGEVTAGINSTKIVTPAMLGKTIITNLASNSSVNINDTRKAVSAGVKGILPVSHGGTGKNSLADITVGTANALTGNSALYNYLHRHDKTTIPKTNAEINKLGLFTRYFAGAGQIDNQPTPYGQLINFPVYIDNDESCQFWIEQPTGKLYHRSGNRAIKINDIPFVKFLDTEDISGDVSNPNAWWVKLNGKIPLIIQGGKRLGEPKNYSFTYPIQMSAILSVHVQKIGFHWACTPSVQSVTNTKVTWDYTDQSDNVFRLDSFIIVIGC